MNETPPWGTVTIALATYRRPHDLHAALASLRSVRGIGRARVVVVDNDTEQSARELVERSDGLNVEYVHEPRPGIAAARNASLDAAGESDWLIFIDDDETFDREWLTELMSCAVRYEASIVSGPVITVYGPDAPRWIVRGGFLQRSRMPTGIMRGKLPATNNVTLRLSYWRLRGAPRFDESFSFTGGSDTDFFSRLIAPGDTVIWCDEALVSEVVPPGRLQARWILRRMIRLGNVDGRIRLRTQSRLELSARAVVRLGYGILRTAGALITGRGLRRKDLAFVTVALGWMGAAADRLVVEYRRDS